MTLTQLLQALAASGCAPRAVTCPPGVSLDGVEVTDLALSSRDVTPGALFVAIVGTTANGHRFVGDAVARGASVLVVSERAGAEGAGLGLPRGNPPPVVVQVDDTRSALTILTRTFFGDPSRGLTLIGVTGTNGKTTSTWLLEAIFLAQGQQVGVIGTVNYRFAGQVLPSPNTTPDLLTFTRLLARMRDAGVQTVIAEVSSHALEQRRVEGLHFDAALFTNLSRDHLDYHPSMDDYAQAKEKLFTQVLEASAKPRKVAVCNADDPIGQRFLEQARAQVKLGFSRSGQDHAALRVLGSSVHFGGLDAALETPCGLLSLKSPLLGAHNLENLLGAFGVALGLGVDAEAILKALAQVQATPGRLEEVPCTHGFKVLVDYAHTPDALARVLACLRPLTRASEGRASQGIDHALVTVFGCGGERDPGKRPLMGQAAVAQSDLTILTSDNPRGEDPQAIARDVLAGLPELPGDLSGPVRPGERRLLVELDRRTAIRRAVAAARPGDIVLIAGKGHEDYQLLPTGKIHFDDREEAREALRLLPPRFTALEVAVATGGTLLRPPAQPEMPWRPCTDTRTLERGQLFIPLVGERFDGHAFLEQVLEQPETAALGLEGPLAALSDAQTRGRALIAVADTLRALGDLAAWHRARLDIPVVGLTGTAGKTSTKDLIRSILAQTGPGLATRGNLNNLVGLPQMVLELAPVHRWAVLELGMSALGEIERLATIAAPRYRLITNVGTAHTEGVGGIDGVARAKGELFATARPGDVVLVNGEDARVRALPTPPGVVRRVYGRDEQADFQLLEVRLEPDGTSHGVLRWREGIVEVSVPLLGAHNAWNAFAAAALALELGVPASAVQAGIAQVALSPMRMERHILPGDILAINDTYNANPQSMDAALDTARVLARQRGTRALVALGDMLELGGLELSAHRALGASVAMGAGNNGVAFLAACGSRSVHTAAGALDAGMAPDRVFHTLEHQAAGEALLRQLRPGDVVLLKGSRGARMEKVFQVLQRGLGLDGMVRETHG